MCSHSEFDYFALNWRRKPVFLEIYTCPPVIANQTSVRGFIRTFICSRRCILYWQGHANCNFISARNLIKFLFQVSKTWVLGHFVLYLHALLIFFFGAFSSKGFFVQLSTSSLKQVFLLDPPPLPLLRICPNSSHIP